MTNPRLTYRVIYLLPTNPTKPEVIYSTADTPADALAEAKRTLEAQGWLWQDSWFIRVWGSTVKPTPLQVDSSQNTFS